MISGLTPPLSPLPPRKPGWQLVIRSLSHAIPIANVDRGFDWIYRRIGFVCFTPPFVALGAAVVLLGAVAHATSPTAPALAAPHVLGVYVALILSMLAHELGHALATKWCGCEIRSVGFGWYWLAPMLFVDTSDTWMASRRGRVIVSAAGPYASLLVASAAAIVARAVGGAGAAVAHEVATFNYVTALVNCNPLFKLDGYYMLIDALDRPRLRSEALQWLTRGLWPARRRPRELWRHRVELAYGVGSLVYVAILAAILLSTSRRALTRLLSTLLSRGVAEPFSWAVTATLALWICVGIAAELAGERRAQPTV
jgi:putative peptide zinc metalloprotease protein